MGVRVRQHLASTCPAPAGSGGTGPTKRGLPGASCGEDDSEEVSWENGVLCRKARNRATGRGVEGRETWLGQEWGQEVGVQTLAAGEEQAEGEFTDGGEQKRQVGVPPVGRVLCGFVAAHDVTALRPC